MYRYYLPWGFMFAIFWILPSTYIIDDYSPTVAQIAIVFVISIALFSFTVYFTNKFYKDTELQKKYGSMGIYGGPMTSIMYLLPVGNALYSIKDLKKSSSNTVTGGGRRRR